ncbi:MAG: CdaR family protein [Ruminococcus sp.]
MKKQSLSQKLLSKNYVIFIFSVVISIAIWSYMSLNASNDTTVTISNIPIQMELSESTHDLGLQIFTGEEQPVASVTVTGNRTILGSVKASDFTVTASANSVTSSGFFTLPVSASKKNPTSNFQITNSTPSSVTVMVDYFKESEFPIQDQISFNVEDGYYGAVSMPYTKVSISGPQSELMKINKVAAVAEVSGTLTESADAEASIVLFDENGNELSTKLLTMNVKTMTVNINVLKEKNVKVETGFTNKPSGLDLSSLTEIYPSSILLAGPEETLKTIVSVKTEAIDFSTLSNEKKTFSALAINIPEKCKNISNNATAKVTLDLSGLSKKEFDVDTFKVEGLSDGYKAEVTSKSISVIVIGPESELDDLSAEKITAAIDVSGSTLKTGSVEMPVTFKFSGVSGCWAYGTYRANLNISEDK